MQRTNLLGSYITMTDEKKHTHNFRMTPAEIMREDFTGWEIKSMRSPMMAKVSELIDATTAAILTAFAKTR